MAARDDAATAVVAAGCTYKVEMAVGGRLCIQEQD